MKRLLIALVLLAGCGKPAPLEPSGPSAPEPNPHQSPAVWEITFKPVEFPEGTITLRIWDSSGRQVRAQVDTLSAARINEISWDGRADDGFPVGGGVYFYEVDISQGLHLTGRLVVVR